MKTSENARYLPLWPGYAVLDDGAVFSRGKPLKPRLVNGYHMVTLCSDRGRKQIAVHRLIACAFIREPDRGEVINHINGVRTDNRLSNIEITTQSRNVQHAYDTGLRQINEAHRQRAATLGRGKRKLTGDTVRAIRQSYTGKRGEVSALARQHNTHHKTVRAILDGRAFGDVT